MSEPGQVEMQGFVKLAASPANALVASSKNRMKRLRKAEISLRIIAVVMAVVAFVFLITDKQKKAYQLGAGVVIYNEARYSDMKALVFAIVALGVVALYSCVQAIRCFLSLHNTAFISTLSLAWSIFLLDQVMAYFMLSSSAAAAESAYLAEQGAPDVNWSKVCYLYERFCNQVGAGIIGSFLVTVNLIVTSGISAFYLFAAHG